MTLPSPNALNSYVGSGSVNKYAYGFFIFSDTHLQVQVQSPTGSLYNLVLNTDYTVSGEGNATGGNLTLVNSGQAWLSVPGGNLLANYSITIQRVVPLVQNTSIRDQGAGYQASIEDALDYAMMAIQQLNAKIAAVNVPVTLVVTSGDISITTVGSGLIVQDSNGDGQTFRIMVQSGQLALQRVT